MAQVSKTREYTTGGALTAANYNADRDEIIAGVNSVNNAQIASNAAIEESKLLFSATGHGHGGSTDGEKVKVTNLDVTGLSAGQVVKVNSGGTALEGGGAGRAFSWYLDGTSINGVGGPKYIAPQTMTVTKIYGITTSGTCVVTLKKGTTTIDEFSCSSILATETTITDSAITAGDIITLTVSSASSPVGLTVTMECRE